MAEPSDAAHAMGRILSNLQSLEFSLRLLLYDLGGLNEQINGTTNVLGDFGNPAVGAWVIQTPLTSYDTLGQIIDKANQELAARSVKERIDTSLVDLRDALAHGRVLSRQKNGPLKLVKFSKPKGNKVQVTVSITLTKEWFSKHINHIRDEIHKVVRISRALGLSGFPPE